MGNQEFRDFTFYSIEQHPIDGNVTVYTIQGEGVYIMSNLIQFTPSINTLYNDIALEEPVNIIKFYGFQKYQSPISTCHIQCSQIAKDMKLSYWEYLNHDLNCQIKKKDKKIAKHFIWDIMEGSIDGALFLKRFKIFLDFKMKFIQFGVDMYPRLYWKNIRPDNTHRYYYRYFFKGELIKAYYSPQELQSIKSKEQNYRLNIQKCSIFSLGVTFLSFFTRTNLIHCYNFKTFQLNTMMLSQALQKVKQIHGEILQYILSGMIQIVVSKRKTFEQIKQFIVLAKKNQLQIPKYQISILKDKMANSQKQSVTVTDNSFSKASQIRRRTSQIRRRTSLKS